MGQSRHLLFFYSFGFFKDLPFQYLPYLGGRICEGYKAQPEFRECSASRKIQNDDASRTFNTNNVLTEVAFSPVQPIMHRSTRIGACTRMAFNMPLTRDAPSSSSMPVMRPITRPKGSTIVVSNVSSTMKIS